MTTEKSHDVSHPLDTLTFDQDHLRHRSFLLGNGGGFVLYLPLATNIVDRTFFPIKWFGASGFGRKFLEAIVVTARDGGVEVPLGGPTQTGFEMDLDGATRIYRVGDTEVRARYFLPDGVQAVVLTLEGNLPFTIRPEFDMRYYQEFNTDFSRYTAEKTPDGVLVTNCVENVGEIHTALDFYGLLAIEGQASVEMRPHDERLIAKTYLKDETRQRLIRSTYRETGAESPDEAPIWDLYGTTVYSPVTFHTDGPATLILAFGDTRDEVQSYVTSLRNDLPRYRAQKREKVARQLDLGAFATGREDADRAYAYLLTRLNETLVARDAILHASPAHRNHFYGIFAGNKYFMDAWKRDENITLEALLVMNDFETMRAILDNTWQHQDPRTGRLPHIIRAGEPFVYYSSDGTLWALHRLSQYTRASGDETLLHEKLDMVRAFFGASMHFVQRGLLPSGGIIQPDYLWETWMDTPFTPRAGYPVEIELLWLTILSEFLPAIREADPILAESMSRALEDGRETFKLFVHDGYLSDSLSYDWQPDTVLTPNGYIAFGLHYPLPAALQRSMVLIARDQLDGHRGIRSLAPKDWARVLPAAFLADPRSHKGKDMASVGIFNYHRGIEWEWLNPFFVSGELQFGNADEAYCRYLQEQIHGTLDEAGIGGLSELYDLHGELGADFQAWSMAGALLSFHLFAGIEVDALNKTICIAPSLPDDWPRLHCRSRVGDTRFDVAYEGKTSGSFHLELRSIDPLPAGYTLRIGIRRPAGSAAPSVRCNSVEVSPDEWQRDDTSDADDPTTFWLTRALEEATNVGETRIVLASH